MSSWPSMGREGSRSVIFVRAYLGDSRRARVAETVGCYHRVHSLGRGMEELGVEIRFGRWEERGTRGWLGRRGTYDRRRLRQ